MVEILVKIACFVKKKTSLLEAADLNQFVVNCIDPSPFSKDSLLCKAFVMRLVNIK